MPRIPLLGGSYGDESLIANAQRSVNLYPESNPQSSQAPVNVTHYVRPGLPILGSPPVLGRGRCLYTATNGDLYALIDQSVYYIDPNYTFTLLGTTLNAVATPAYMADNGTNIVLVDGGLIGYSIVMATRAFGTIGDPNFLGADRVDYLDGFLIFNKPNTPIWYASDFNAITFNALSFGSKAAWADNISTLIAVQRQAWLMGPQKGEVAFNAGTSPFPFESSPGIIIEHGIEAKYSIAKQDVNIYWLSRSPEGARMAMKGNQQSAVRISNHAVEAEWLTYPRVDDAIGSVYQIKGHAFYKIHFPTQDITWGYDEATSEWHEDASSDVNGVLHRANNTFCAYAYGKNLALDWRNGNLLHIDENTFSDDGTRPIVCIRSFPHLLDDEFDRQTCWRIIADIESGTPPNVLSPQITLRVSRDRGATFVSAGLQPFGPIGAYATKPTWNRLGMAADFVFELSWENERKTSLNGVFGIFEMHEADSS